MSNPVDTYPLVFSREAWEDISKLEAVVDPDGLVRRFVMRTLCGEMYLLTPTVCIDGGHASLLFTSERL